MANNKKKNAQSEYKARIVVNLSEEFTKAALEGFLYTDVPALEPLKKALAVHKADLHNSLRDFEYYVQSSEAHGADDFPMVNWTRDAVQNDFARAKYIKRFTVAVNGEKVFDPDKAAAIAEALQPLVGQGVVESVQVQTMDPRKNPPIPQRYLA